MKDFNLFIRPKVREQFVLRISYVTSSKSDRVWQSKDNTFLHQKIFGAFSRAQNEYTRILNFLNFTHCTRYSNAMSGKLVRTFLPSSYLRKINIQKYHSMCIIFVRSVSHSLRQK